MFSGQIFLKQFLKTVSSLLKATQAKVQKDLVMNKKLSNQMEKMPFKVSIEGNIGCGKSTLINHFRRFSEVDARLEPLDKWRNVQGHNLLMLLYNEPQRWNFTFQHYVQLTRLELQAGKSNCQIKILERSLQNNRFCFIESARASGLLSEPDYASLCEWYSWIEQNVDIGLDLIVYLRSDPRTVFERMQRRGRVEESSVSLEYLTQIHESYEKWLVNCDPALLPAPVLVIDVNSDLSAVQKTYKTVEQYIFGNKQLPVTGYVKEFGWGHDRLDTITC